MTTASVRMPICVTRAVCGALIAAALVLSLPGPAWTGEPGAVQLSAPDRTRGLPFMETLSVKASAREWSDEDLSLADLSDLLWAANGVNRPEEKKYTASSALNAHDVDLYVFMKDGAYVYDADSHTLAPVLVGDFRSELVAAPPTPSNPPVQIILISDSARFRMGTEEQRYEWGAIDAGIVSQNISLFCAATGLKTRPRASMDRERIRTLLSLRDEQHVFLNHPVGYARRDLDALPPSVVKTVPQCGDLNVDPGLREVTVTFSKDMKVTGHCWSWCSVDDESFPKLPGGTRFLEDNRTCVLPVALEPDRTYAIWINTDEFHSFQDPAGHTAVPYLIVFRTGSRP